MFELLWRTPLAQSMCELGGKAETAQLAQAVKTGLIWS